MCARVLCMLCFLQLPLQAGPMLVAVHASSLLCWLLSPPTSLERQGAPPGIGAGRATDSVHGERMVWVGRLQPLLLVLLLQLQPLPQPLPLMLTS